MNLGNENADRNASKVVFGSIASDKENIFKDVSILGFSVINPNYDI